MESKELIFLFEISVDDIISFSNTKKHEIRAQFGDVFTLQLKDPNQVVSRRISYRSKRAIKIRKGKVQSHNKESNQIAVVVSDVESLVRNMLDFPIELTHYSKEEPFVLGVVEIPWTMLHIDYLKNLVSSSDQPPVVLSGTYKTYDAYTSKRVAIVTLTISVSQMKSIIQNNCDEQNGDVPINEDTPFNIGTIRTIYSGGKLDGRRRKQKNEEKDSSSQNNKMKLLDVVTENSNDTPSPHNVQKVDSTNEAVTFSEVKKSESDQIITKEPDSIPESLNNIKYKEISQIEGDDTLTQKINIGKVSKVNLIRSQHALLDKTDKLTLIQPISEIKKRWSNTDIEVKQRLDTLNYIFGNPDGPFGNRVYCVEYFTVENYRIEGVNSPKQTFPPLQSPTPTPGLSPPKTPDENSATTPDNTSGSASPKSTSSKTSGSATPKNASDKYRMNICGKKCIFGGQKNPCFENVCEVDLPEKASKLISVTKCSQIACGYRKKAASLTDPFPDEVPILVDFGKSQSTKDCCAKDIKDVKVLSGMTANFIQDPCSCTCECTFGFITKTTYCNICGGFEVPGDELKSTRGDVPFPCPIYHGWQQKGKKGQSKKSSQTGDDSVKGGRGKSIDSDKDSTKSNKKRKRKRDPRFKFNYGYKGIPPQIGHSQCAMPCTGDLHPVPKHMGWLWTADNTIGLRGWNAENNPFLKALANGWRPGAISKRLLHKLNKAKQNTSTVLNKKPLKKQRKREYEKKPALIVAKRNGEYIVEMQVNDKNDDNTPCKPLIYKIASPDREERMKLRALKTQRLIEKARKEVKATDWYNPDACEQKCGKAYKMATGAYEYDLAMAECICPEDMIDSNDPSTMTESSSEVDSSDYSSLDLDWEIHFTPPNITRKED